MKSVELLELVQVQRHDFLNHLQVISGLVQLNKSDRVLDYIKQVSAEMGELSVITKLRIPELKAVLLVSLNKASKSQVEFNYDINTNMADCTTAGHVLGEAVKECINVALENLSPPEIEDRRMLFSINEGNAKYTFKFGFPGLASNVVKGLEEKLKYCRSLSSRDFQTGVAVMADRAEIYFTVPK